MSSQQDLKRLSGFRRFCKHANLMDLINTQRAVLYDHYDGPLEAFKELLRENNELRSSVIDLMLDDRSEHHPILFDFEDIEAASYIERVFDLANVGSSEEFQDLIELLWTYLVSDDHEESENAKERIEEFMNPGMKYAFVLSADSRGLDAEGINVLQDYILDQYNDNSTLVVIEDEVISDPSYLAEKIVGENRIDDIITGVMDCYVFVLHGDDNQFMECITGQSYLNSLVKTLLINDEKLSWVIAMYYVMGAGIEPVLMNDV